MRVAEFPDGGGIEHLHPGAPVLDACLPGLSLHCAFGARYELRLDDRAVVLDDEVAVVATPRRRLRGRLRPGDGGRALVLHYAPGAALRLVAGLPLARHAADAGWDRQADDLHPPEHVRAQRRPLGLLLRFIARQVDEGLDDPAWYREQAWLALRLVLQEDLRAAAAAAREPPPRPASRRALVRRMSRITDLIHSRYEQRLTLSDFSAAANLSAWHVLRSFKALHGMTPHEFLQRRRLDAGLRLLGATGEAVGRIARQVGFADRRSFDRTAARALPKKSGGPEAAAGRNRRPGEARQKSTLARTNT